MEDLESRCFIKRNGALYPSDMHADDLMATLKDGKEVLVRIHKPRNVQQHKLMFSILSKVSENSEVWPDVKSLLSAVKRAVGLMEAYIDVDGVIRQQTRSVSFASMPQQEFERFLPRALNVLARISGIDEEILLKESK
jgi:hypothetical protein